MADSEQPESRTRRLRRIRRVPGWANHAGAALLPVLACFLGGATQKWAEGIVVALLGMFLLFDPPRFSLGRLTNSVLVAFVLVATFAFLPSHWFFIPDWRTALVDDFGVLLPATVSAQPWITGTCLISLIAGVSWLYFGATQESDLRSIRFQLRLFVTGVVILAAVSIALYFLRASFPFWINQRGFGPFPNRNQTANLFGITSIVLLACGQDDIRHGRKRWILWLIGLGILITAIILNFSRAGMAILVGGSALWIAAVAFRQQSSARIALAVSFLLLLLTAILLLGGQTLERFHLHTVGGMGVTADFRWKIFRDVFELIRQSPWCGVGLGNFDPVFALFRRLSLTETRALHPESDWLWMWVEMGWPAVVLTILGAALLIRRVLPLQEGTNQRFRLAALLGAILFALHGLIDVSAHRVGTAYAGIFMLGVCLHRPLVFRTSRIAPIFFRVLGLFLLVAGISWTIAVRNKTLLPGSVGVSNIKELAPVAIRGRNFPEAIALTNLGLHWAPLDWQLYFSRALAELAAKKPELAVDDFRRARFLEPNSFEVPLAEGTAWLSSNPTFAATAWREALRRTETGRQRLEVYAGMLNKASVESAQVGRILEEVGLTQHDLVLAYLSRVSGKLFTRELERFLKNDFDLRTLTDPEKLAFFSLWSERGDLSELARQVQEHPDWIRYAWFGVAKYNASQQDFHSAYELTQRFGDAVAMPRIPGGTSLEELQNRYYTNPDNYATGYALYREQMQRGRIDDALLAARHFSERPNAPPYFHVLEAQAWAAKQNWERAWQAWSDYRDATTKK
jgi:O-antigen ligase/tetratricopeptide (TPR) repeat protein